MAVRKKVLVLFAHPRCDRSECNVRLAAAARAVEGVTFVDLYSEYPTFEIDIDREQERVVAHDVIVFQHPIYWYSTPAILKEWQDLVLEYGFAYGAEGRALEGKWTLNAVTCGARRDVYTRDGAYRAELREFLLPIEQSMLLCRAHVLPPFSLFAAGHADDEGRLDPHIEAYRKLLRALVEDRVDLEGARGEMTLSDEFDRWIRPEVR